MEFFKSRHLCLLVPILLLLCGCNSQDGSTYELEVLPLDSSIEIQILERPSTSVAMQPSIQTTASSSQQISVQQDTKIGEQKTNAYRIVNLKKESDAKALIAEYDNKIFFTVRKFVEKTPTNVAKWYDHQCLDPALQTLVRAVIARIDSDEKTEEKLSSDSKTTTHPKCVIFDIDETLVHQNEDRTFSLILPIYDLYTYFKRKAYTIYFVSARPESSRNITVKLLNDFGFDCKNGEHLYLIPSNENNPALFKENARSTLAEYFQIIATIDDQWQNLVGQHVGRYAIWLRPFLNKDGDNIFYNAVFDSKKTKQLF